MSYNNGAVIEAVDLGKRYEISTARSQASTPVSPFGRFARRFRRADVEALWALRNVSFQMQQGEVVGIIGGNGSGKSTLLKVLSRITPPTTGVARLYGRVGSLLEVGTGFQPEMTGRENVYLSGSILGMRRSDIESRFDQVVDFAGVERFLDVPVKRYSSGMYVRLAFAVAAHLEPEILLVDEVLAVGDAAFQRKSIGKMKEIGRTGLAVMFVSHSMEAILNLCHRALLLSGGCVQADADPQTVVNQYLGTIDRVSQTPLALRQDRQGNQALRFTGFDFKDAAGLSTAHVYSGQDMVIALAYESRKGSRLRDVNISIGIHGTLDENLFDLSTSYSGFDFEMLPGSGVIGCQIHRLPLMPGRYSFNVYCTVAGELSDWVLNAGVLEVEPGDFFRTGKLPHASQGTFLVPHSWNLRESEDVADYRN